MKISIALCTFNGEKFLKQQLDSILNQKGVFDIEIIICDDKSTDKTVEILNNYEQKYQNIFQIFENVKNLGSTKNFEKAISLCNGDFIFLADQDDVWIENKISETLKSFNDNEKIEGVFSNGHLIDGDGQKFTHITLWQSVFFKENQLLKPIDYFDLMAKNGNVVTGSTLCLNKSAKQFVLPIPEKFNHDEWIATVLSLRDSLSNNPSQLINYRIHKNQQIGLKLLKNLNRLEHRKNIILGIQNPVNFKDYRILQKKQYLKFKKAKILFEFEFDNVDLDSLVKNSITDIEILNEKIKNKFPLQFTLFNFVDKMLGKRQI